ncbi:hypothetical protein EYF80_041519 [Liparis tanakae]|uniref:Uncharacterized protein n=1 Tax=Liparis tanakae TaxID=230148 RepID=A0A4Z2G412_9TELE|nr:hypothetical protein EYF80_041519 [Liparis tanakae]
MPKSPANDRRPRIAAAASSAENRISSEEQEALSQNTRDLRTDRAPLSYAELDQEGLIGTPR